MALTKQQIAIKCWYAGRRKASAPPRDRIVLDGKVKLTPRRREILFHVACTDAVWWNLEKDYSKRWSNHRKFEPCLGATRVNSIVSYLKKHKLVRFSPTGGFPAMDRKDFPPILLVTPRGMDALLECTEFRNERKS